MSVRPKDKSKTPQGAALIWNVASSHHRTKAVPATRDSHFPFLVIAFANDFATWTTTFGKAVLALVLALLVQAAFQWLIASFAVFPMLMLLHTREDVLALQIVSLLVSKAFLEGGFF